MFCHPDSHGLESFDDEGFGKARGGPLLKGRQRHHGIHVVLRLWRHWNRKGAKAMHHGRKHRVRTAKGSEQERPELAIALAALDTDLLKARDNSLCLRR